MRLDDRIAMVVGAGQSPGETMGNGRATALLFAREGAKIVAVDRDLASAQETVALIRDEGGNATAVEADVKDEVSVKAAVEKCLRQHGSIDILHNNVGISLAGEDAEITDITVEAFDHCVAVNLRGMVLTCKHTLPSMQKKGKGVIINISSLAAWSAYPLVAYKTTKSAVIALTEQLAIQNAKFGVRANALLPGLMDTPMAVDTRVRVLKKVGRKFRPSVELRSRWVEKWVRPGMWLMPPFFWHQMMQDSSLVRLCLLMGVLRCR